MSITKEQAMAYTEVVEVLKYMSKEEVNKIPKDILDFYNNNMDVSYKFNVNINKPFEEQVLLEKTKLCWQYFLEIIGQLMSKKKK